MHFNTEGTAEGQINRAWVLEWFALEGEGATQAFLDDHKAMNLTNEEFDDAAEDLRQGGHLYRDEFGDYRITAYGADEYASGQSVISSIEAEINRQAFGEQVAA